MILGWELVSLVLKKNLVIHYKVKYLWYFTSRISPWANCVWGPKVMWGHVAESAATISWIWAEGVAMMKGDQTWWNRGQVHTAYGPTKKEAYFLPLSLVGAHPLCQMGFSEPLLGETILINGVQTTAGCFLFLPFFFFFPLSNSKK